MKTLLKKGYTLEVVTWENDGDNYETNFQTFESKEEALKVSYILKNVFVSINNGQGGVGNSSERDVEEVECIIEEFHEKLDIFTEDELSTIRSITWSKYPMTHVIRDKYRELLGYTEWYLFRVFESARILYTPEDIKVEVIEIK